MIQIIKKITACALISTTLLTTRIFAQSDRVSVDRQIRFSRGSISRFAR